MAKKKSSDLKKIAVGVLIIVIAGLVSIPIVDFMSKPNLVPSTGAGPDTLCPAKLDFSIGGTSNFGLTFTNHGDEDGSFSTTVSSKDVLVTYRGTETEYSSSSTQSWYAKQDTEVDFNFSLKRINDENPPENIQIETTAKCVTDLVDTLALSCGKRSFSCSYALNEENRLKTFYNLVQ